MTEPWETVKTKFWRDLARFGSSLSWFVSGVLSPAVCRNNLKIRIDVKSLRSGKPRVLATKAGLDNNHIKTRCELLIIDEQSSSSS